MENSLKGKFVLIVDDEERNVFALGSYLESKDMKVLSARNGKDALNMMSGSDQIDIVLLDMMMPVMDGYEVATEMKNDETLRKIPVIALTARAMKGDMEKCLAAGAWDYVSKPADLKLLISKMQHWIQIDENELVYLLKSIRMVHGYDFTEYAEASVKRRIQHFMTIKGIRDLRSLSKLLLQDEKFFEEFVQEFSVTVTEMFRDPSFYKSLRENVVKRLATYPFIKIWIAGCATGEEVYSIAIMLKEEGLLSKSVIYATDINQKSLRKAMEGIYPIENMKGYTVNYQKAGGLAAFSDYYVSKYDGVLFDKSLRQNIVFSPHNLVVDRSFNEFQLIICRNVLIYFNQQLQNKVITLLYESLCTFGFLGLGNKESLLFCDKQKNFDDVDKRERIFMKTR